jgi:hypothetical protein
VVVDVVDVGDVAMLLMPRHSRNGRCGNSLEMPVVDVGGVDVGVDV